MQRRINLVEETGKPTINTSNSAEKSTFIGSVFFYTMVTSNKFDWITFSCPIDIDFRI